LTRNLKTYKSTNTKRQDLFEVEGDSILYSAPEQALERPVNPDFTPGDPYARKRRENSATLMFRANWMIQNLYEICESSVFKEVRLVRRNLE
jgi:hypothetical protein